MSGEKGRSAYEEHVANSRFPRRFHRWHRLPSHIRAIFAEKVVKPVVEKIAKAKPAAKKAAKSPKEKKS